MKKGTFALEKNAHLPLYLPMEIQILLSVEREIHLIAHGTKILRKTDIFQFVLFPGKRKTYSCMWTELYLIACREKQYYALLPVERGVCLWRQRCTFACEKKDVFTCLWREVHLITFGEKDVLNCLWRVRNTLACGERCTSCNCFGE